MKLHIIYNEKVTQRTISVFEDVFPHQNKFIVMNKKGASSFDTSIYHSEIVFVDGTSKEELRKAVGNTSAYQHIILHFLNEFVAEALSKVNHPSIYWIEWGGDLYVNLLGPRGFTLYENEPLFFKMTRPHIPVSIAKVLYRIKRKMVQRTVVRFVKKVKYFVPDSMPGEYELLLSYYPELSHLQYRSFFYYPIDSIIKNKDLTSKGGNIMVNHSASLSGNHAGVFKRLSELELGAKKIIVPISYGNKTYAGYLEDLGKSLFGSNAIMVKEFMELSKYNDLLCDCSVFIYGHYRQEAVGNILVALYLGGKVFLYERNPLYGFYKGLGLNLFSIDSDLNSESICTKLSVDQINENKKILNDYYSMEQMKLNIRKSFE